MMIGIFYFDKYFVDWFIFVSYLYYIFPALAIASKIYFCVILWYFCTFMFEVTLSSM